MSNEHDEVIEIIKSVVGPTVIVDDSYIVNEKNELDSLSLARLVFSLEDKYQIKLSLSYFSTPRHISDVVKKVISNE